MPGSHYVHNAPTYQEITRVEQERPAIASDLRRDLRLLDAVAVGLGAIIGAGIFVVTGVAAGVAGPAFLVGLVIAGGVATCNALSSAQLAATYPQSGGTYEYGYRLLHPWLGFVGGWVFLISKLAAAGTVALGFAGYLHALIPAIPQRAAAVAVIILLTAINYIGIRKTGRLNIVIVSISLATLLYLIVAGLPALDMANLRPFAPQGWRGVLQSAALLFFAYTGYARLATLGEEVADPKRTIPKAIMLALGIAILLYMLVALVAVGGVGAEAMAATSSPLERAAQAFALPGVALAVAIGATTAMLGVLLSQILGISRMLFAMARRHDLPVGLAHVHPTFEVPDRGIILTGLAALVVALFGTLETIVAAASFSILIYYMLANLSALRMRPQDKLFPNWVPVLGAISCAALALTLRLPVILGGLGMLAAGVVWRIVYRRVSGHVGDEENLER
jgi:basic amino acid/polyamine antiporter, APA family